ncbi:MAG TPA: zf-TFIIB domain-containing protein [Kofleriaceae bacterium]|nr:zf-TFIIB domain-containing protein [Kofleriaceae bacterium]
MSRSKCRRRRAAAARRCGTSRSKATGYNRAVNCPRCETPMKARLVADTAIHECPSCSGLFLTHGMIERILEGREEVQSPYRGGALIANELLATLPHAKTNTLPPAGQRMYIKCPSCSTLMNRKLFATGANIVIDVCRADGAFFDVGELPAIVEFVMKGGLETAARKDASRAVEARRAKELDAKLQAASPGAATMRSGSAELDAGVALVDLLFSLFS